MQTYRLIKWFQWRTEQSIYGCWLVVAASDQIKDIYIAADQFTSRTEILVNDMNNDYRPEGILEFRIERCDNSRTSLIQPPEIKRMKS